MPVGDEADHVHRATRPDVFRGVSPAAIPSVFVRDLPPVDEEVGDVGDDETEVDGYYENGVEEGAELEVEEHLAEKTSVDEQSHQNDPVGDQLVLELLLVPNVGEEEKDGCKDEAGERNQVDVQRFE